MTYPRTGSILTEHINTGLSTQIRVSVNNIPVGAIQSLTITQNRTIEISEEIGTEGNVDGFPKGSAKIDIIVNRIVFDGLTLPPAFSRCFTNIQAQRIPFNIEIMDNTNFESRLPIINTIEGCWFSQYSPTYEANNFIISEKATIKAERIITNQGGISAINGGKRGILFERDEIEIDTDINGSPGKYTIDNLGDPLINF